MRVARPGIRYPSSSLRAARYKPTRQGLPGLASPAQNVSVGDLATSPSDVSAVASASRRPASQHPNGTGDPTRAFSKISMRPARRPFPLCKTISSTTTPLLSNTAFPFFFTPQKSHPVANNPPPPSPSRLAFPHTITTYTHHTPWLSPSATSARTCPWPRKSCLGPTLRLCASQVDPKRSLLLCLSAIREENIVDACLLTSITTTEPPRTPPPTMLPSRPMPSSLASPASRKVRHSLPRVP